MLTSSLIQHLSCTSLLIINKIGLQRNESRNTLKEYCCYNAEFVIVGWILLLLNQMKQEKWKENI